MRREVEFVAARVHESGCYFFCPYCTLSFPHPPRWERYLVGYGYCCYCFRYVPLEGGDKKGVVTADGAGRLHTVLDDASEKEMTREKLDALLEEMYRGKLPFRDGHAA